MNQMTWMAVLPSSGSIGILGKKRQGKSGAAYHIAELRNTAHGIPAIALGPPVSMAAEFPPWVTIATDIHDLLRHPKHTVIFDEGSLAAHARKAVKNTDLDVIQSLCGQLEQLFIFCTHHSRKLDVNLVADYDILAFKRPGRLQAELERSIMKEYSERARDALLRIPEQERKQWSYVYYDDLDAEALIHNPLPSFWTDRLSAAVSIGMAEGVAVTGDVDAVRRLCYDLALSVWDTDLVQRQLLERHGDALWTAMRQGQPTGASLQSLRTDLEDLASPRLAQLLQMVQALTSPSADAKTVP